MTIRYLLIATTALALTACDSRTDTTVSTTATETTDAAGNAVDNTGNAISNAANDIGQSEPVNAVQDAVGGVVGQASAAAANSVEGYVTNAAIGDMYEIEASKIAQEKAKSPALKSFAAQMVKDHTATTAEVKKIVSSGSLAVTPPTQLDARRKGFIDNLKAASAADFDEVYIDQQVAAHKEALTLHRSYVDDGDNAALKAFAAKTAPKVQAHLDMVEKMDNAD